MHDNTRNKKMFLRLPKYPGGKKALIAFIEKNKKYPPKAIENKVEGMVFLTFNVTNMGLVINARVINGIGGGCDEEALRLVNLLEFGKAKNRGVRVTASHKMNIKFKLPPVAKKVKLNYNTIKAVDANSKKDSGGKSYSYSINL